MPAPTKLRILSLEDSAIDSEIILRELQVNGALFKSTRVDNRADYISAIHEFSPNIILADYKLPDFDGAMALEIAKDLCPDVPLIVISGAVGEETAVELIKSGATDFVLKDHLGRLAPAVQRALLEVESRNACRKAEADLRSLNEELEHRVEERTQELQEKNAAMEEDLEMARELQMAFLPSHFPTIPHGVSEAASAVKFASVFYPSSSVSGDFYNIVRISESAVGIFICDVMGHGVRAALVTAIMRALEERLGEEAGNPGALLTQLNHQLRIILQHLDTTMFASACYITVDTASGRITFANAGHPYPLLIRGTTGEVEVIGTGSKHGPALGLLDGISYDTHKLTVDAGDRILLFTDGLFEVENEKKQAFSQSRLRDVIQQHSSLLLDNLLQDISNEIKDFAQNHVFTDDVCLVGVEISRLDAQIAKAE